MRISGEGVRVLRAMSALYPSYIYYRADFLYVSVRQHDGNLVVSGANSLMRAVWRIPNDGGEDACVKVRHEALLPLRHIRYDWIEVGDDYALYPSGVRISYPKARSGEVGEYMDAGGYEVRLDVAHILRVSGGSVSVAMEVRKDGAYLEARAITYVVHGGASSGAVGMRVSFHPRVWRLFLRFMRAVRDVSEVSLYMDRCNKAVRVVAARGDRDVLTLYMPKGDL